MTYPTFSREQLVTRALRVLGVVPAGQTPEAEDRAVVDDLVVPLLARLNAEKITYHVDQEGNVTQLDDPEAIPAKAFMDVAILLADVAKQDFGIAALPQADPSMSEMRLRTVWAVGPSQEEYEEWVVDLDTDEATLTTLRRNQTLVGEYF